MATKQRRKPLTKKEKAEIVDAALDKGKEVLFGYITAFTKMSTYLRKQNVIDENPHEVRIAVTKVKKKKYAICYFDGLDNDSIWGIVEIVPNDAYGTMYGGSVKYETRGFIRDSEFLKLTNHEVEADG